MRFYTRDGCHLCDETRGTLQAVLEERAAAGKVTPVVREVDIATDPTAHRRYLETIPVLAIDGAELPLATDARKIGAFLDRALARAIA